MATLQSTNYMQRIVFVCSTFAYTSILRLFGKSLLLKIMDQFINIALIYYYLPS